MALTSFILINSHRWRCEVSLEQTNELNHTRYRSIYNQALLLFICNNQRGIDSRNSLMAVR